LNIQASYDIENARDELGEGLGIEITSVENVLTE
jgi:hypothetical protein